jgi:hypothetical protein
MSVVEYKKVYATQVFVWVNDKEIEGYEAECIVEGCGQNNTAYILTAEKPEDNLLSFVDKCEHLAEKETDSLTNYDYDALFSFGAVLGEEEFLPPEKCWNLAFK